MNRDVFLAILAMDSYDRGYGAGVNGLSETGAIGTATIRPFKPGQQSGWQAAGFYAIAYNWNGETVISYRGTDSSTKGATVTDAANGWIISLGADRASQIGRPPCSLTRSPEPVEGRAHPQARASTGSALRFDRGLRFAA